MQYPFKKHPLRSAIGTIVVFLLISLPLYLGGIWPLLEWARIVTPLPPDQSLPQWIREQRWPGMTSSIFNLIILGSVVGMFVFLAAIIRAVYQNRRDVGWLEALAQNQTATMNHLVRVVHMEHFRFPVTPYFSDIKNQFVVFSIPIVNRSIYTLTLGEIENQFTFDGKLLPDLPHIKSTPGLPQDAKNTAYFTVEIVQKISSPIVECIQSQGGGTFGAHNISIKFSYRDYTDTPQTVNVNVGGTISFSLTSN